MLIIPAIDILGGKCVRLTKGDFSTGKVYFSDPLEVAKKLKEQGAEILHVVDLDAAKTGKPVNQELILRIAKTSGIPLEVGGGIRDIKIARMYLNSGIAKIILGTSAAGRASLLARIIKEFGAEKIMVALEVKQNKLAINGWQQTTNENYFDFAKKLKDIGVSNILFTDIDKDGSLTKPNFKIAEELLGLGFNVTVSGGISDIKSLRKLKYSGACGAVLGKSLYEKKLDLRKVISDLEPISNLAKRIIPCLDVKDGRVVKGISFNKLRDAGDPVVLGRKYSDEGADELVFLDIAASKENRQTLFDLVAKVAKEVFIPFTVGGGIKNLSEIRKLLKLGADKISINTSAVKNPNFITKASLAFGQQCIVVAIDAKKENGGYKVFLKGGTQETGLDVLEWAAEAERRGAGEILLTSIDKDGTKSGYDLDLLKMVSGKVKIPVIASGGAGSLKDLKSAFTKGRADAILLASLLHYNQLTVGQVKN